MYQKIHKNLFFRFLFSFISILLIFLLIMNSSIIDCFAVAGVDDALFWILCAIMAACGVTFVSVESAHLAADALWDNLDDGIQKVLEQKSTDINVGLLAGATWTSIGVGFLSEQWTQIIQSITGTFGDFTGIDARISIETSGLLVAGESFTFNVPGVSSSSAINVSVGNASVSYVGNKSSVTLPDYINFTVNSSSYVLRILSISGFDFVVNRGSFSNAVNLSEVMTYLIPNNLEHAIYINFSFSDIIGSKHYFNCREITKTIIGSGTFTFNYVDTGENIVQDCMLGDIAISDSICPDGLWTHKSWSDWLNEQIFGDDIPNVGALPGNPSIDTPAYPGNDVWHDGSINDDIAVGSPSIGIAVPTSDEDVISLNPDFARDYENTTVKDKDIATDTDTDTSTDTDTDTDDTPSSIKPSGLPAMSLPETLFKEKFPFCLPWDLYNVFVILNAEPIAPKFDIPFKFERFGIDYVFTIDLSDYEQFALISRASLSITFVIALILLSRKIIGA